MRYATSSEVLLESFFRSLDIVNKSIANNISDGLLMDHTYEEANVMLEQKKKINRAWHMRATELVSSASTKKL